MKIDGDKTYLREDSGGEEQDQHPVNGWSE